jgi:hypothetical protein
VDSHGLNTPNKEWGGTKVLESLELESDLEGEDASLKEPIIPPLPLPSQAASSSASPRLIPPSHSRNSHPWSGSTPESPIITPRTPSPSHTASGSAFKTTQSSFNAGGNIIINSGSSISLAASSDWRGENGKETVRSYAHDNGQSRDLRVSTCGLEPRLCECD